MRRGLRAAFYRGGTSKAVVFNGADLPADQAERDRIFLQVLGSPDPYGRQLDGMGGGISSLSKVVIVERSAREDADVDYTFVQIAVDQPVADYGSACGNMSSCVGPFAVEEGLVQVAEDGEALVRIFNTNTGQIYHARFPVQDGMPVEQGDFVIPGVSGSGARVTLDFLQPGGAATGRLLPTGNPVDLLEVEGLGTVEVSLIDAANPVVFVAAQILGKTATELPQQLDTDAEYMACMDAIRRAGGVAMGMGGSSGEVTLSNPKVAIIGAPSDFTALDGSTYGPDSHDIGVRLISMGNSHRAITLTGGMCSGVAAHILGTLVNRIAGAASPVRIGNPSGVLPVNAHVQQSDGGPKAISASTFRTQRRIMDGTVFFSDTINT
ncbi:PrpF domain-containing protein [Ruegeria sp. 2205SS24-7]|uniref:2-methylaconitate cis-trans isomerase PrpF family protein n=1 Tax=Ruegeria discodermiae TaxID=3064389 RepID=UPI002741C012|nr:PrpF domain-containing protein [Ruegeria sp. 2205SS24-7]MDP5216981.1 PrpF domain-containing protein [Ruegeria sp. 2205SS24-7]